MRYLLNYITDIFESDMSESINYIWYSLICKSIIYIWCYLGKDMTEKVSGICGIVYFGYEVKGIKYMWYILGMQRMLFDITYVV